MFWIPAGTTKKRFYYNFNGNLVAKSRRQKLEAGKN